MLGGLRSSNLGSVGVPWSSFSCSYLCLSHVFIASECKVVVNDTKEGTVGSMQALLRRLKRHQDNSQDAPYERLRETESAHHLEIDEIVT